VTANISMARGESTQTQVAKAGAVDSLFTAAGSIGAPSSSSEPELEVPQASREDYHWGAPTYQTAQSPSNAPINKSEQPAPPTANAGLASKTEKAKIHHLATNKNTVSKARGGPWTPRFEAIFNKAGMTLEDALNKVPVLGHQGPHPAEYHQAVYDRLLSATRGLSGEQYAAALKAELTALGKEAKAPGTLLNQLLTGRR
jgi:hypothetical protein